MITEKIKQKRFENAVKTNIKGNIIEKCGLQTMDFSLKLKQKGKKYIKKNCTKKHEKCIKYTSSTSKNLTQCWYIYVLNKGRGEQVEKCA